MTANLLLERPVPIRSAILAICETCLSASKCGRPYRRPAGQPLQNRFVFGFGCGADNTAHRVVQAYRFILQPICFLPRLSWYTKPCIYAEAGVETRKLELAS
jgi:hypothetical protein